MPPLNAATSWPKSAQAAWVYKDLRTKARWVWVAQSADLAPIYSMATGLFIGLLPTESTLIETVCAALADKYQAECSGSSVPKGALLRAVGSVGAVGIKGGGRILWQELSMIDPPMRHRDPQDVVDWVHKTLLAKFPGLHEPMMVMDREVDPDNWAKTVIQPALIRAHALTQARELKKAIKDPATQSAAPLPRL